MNTSSRNIVVGVLVVLILLLSNLFPNISAEAEGENPVDSKVSGRLAMHVQVKSACVSCEMSPQSTCMSERTREVISADQNGLSLERVFIYFSEQPGPDQIDELVSLGIKPYPETWLPPVGNHPYGFILADMPLDRLEDLAERNYVTRIDTAEQQMQCQNDVTRAVTGIGEVWSGGNTGAGVRIAVLDSGIDVSNPDFPTLNTTNSKDYSEYPTLDDVIGNTVTGHGTHVVGSVLGRGVNSPGYKGVAPGADLIFLKIGNDETASASVDSICMAIRDAVDVYQANIITLSYGGWSEHHDGSDATSQAVDYATSRGVTVFVAAGNSGNADWHYSGTVNAGESVDVPICVYYGYSYLDMNLVWFDGLGVRKSFELGFYTTTGTRLISKSVRKSESLRGTESLYCYLDNQVGVGNYSLKVTNNSSSAQSFHLYYSDSNSCVMFPNSDPEYTLNSPAEADGAIAVGAYVSRANWLNFEGDTYRYQGAGATGTTATFSSRGPRVDNTQIEKPEIIAPGSAIISVRDNDVYSWPNINGNADISDYHYNIIDNDGQNLNGFGPADYFVMQGTSMACPAAAGVAALMLSVNPGLTPAEIREVLIETATDKESPGFDTRSGWGLINAAEAVSEVTVDWEMGFSTSEQVVIAGEVSGIITIQIRNGATGEEQEVFTDTTFTLTSTSETGRFDISPTGPFDGTSVTVPTWASRADFYYRDTVAGNAIITVSGEKFDSISQEISISPAGAASISIETAADGTGTGVPEQSLAPGEFVTVYSVTRDEFGNLTEDSNNTAWSLVEVSGEVAESDLSAISGSSVTLTGNLPGAARIRGSLEGLEADSGVITVMSGTVDRLEITAQPDSTLSLDFPFDTVAVVTAYDANNNPVTFATITAGIDEGSGELSGTLSSVTDSNGQALFGDLRYNRTDEFKIKFIFRDKSVISGPVGPLKAGVPASLSLATAPVAGSTVDEALDTQPVIKVEDQFGNASGGAGVTASVNMGTGELNGTLTATSAEGSGLAAFTDLGYSKSGESFSIRFNCGELTVSSDALGPLEPGEAVVVQVEKAANGTGKPVTGSNLTVGSKLNVYSITRDQYGNFVENSPAEWSLVDMTGGVTDEDLVPPADGKSAVLTGKVPGTAIIRAAIPGLTVIDSGIINIQAAPSGEFSVGFGGFGGGQGSATLKPVGFTTTTVFSLNNDGTISDGLDLQTIDGRVTLNIAANTRLLNEAGNALPTLSAAIISDPPQAPPGGMILLCYEFGPEGASFDPPLKLTYRIDSLPEGVDPDSLRIAYWNGTDWNEVPCTADAATGIVTAEIGHFSRYAVLVDLFTPAEFAIGGIRISPETVQPDEPVSVRVTVENVGGSAGTFGLVLKVEGVELDIRELFLNAGESREISFTIKKDIPGDYVVDINGQTGRFSVAAVPLVTETPEPSGEPVRGSEPWEATPLGGTATAAPVTDEGNPSQPLWHWLLVGVVIVAVAGGILLFRKKAGRA